MLVVSGCYRAREKERRTGASRTTMELLWPLVGFAMLVLLALVERVTGRRLCSPGLKAVLACGLIGASIWSGLPQPIPPQRLSGLLEEQRRSFAADVDALRKRERDVAAMPQMRAIVQSLEADLWRTTPTAASGATAAPGRPRRWQ